MPVSASELFVRLEPPVVDECTTTADAIVVSGRILDALGVEDQDGVWMQFDHEACLGRIIGLQQEDRDRILAVATFQGGAGVGSVSVSHDPDVWIEDGEQGC
jgi:hypothetical protein